MVKRFQDGSILEYDRGRFDDYCLYLTRPGGHRHAPRDIDYFQTLVDLGQRYGTRRLYDHYVSIYHRTNADLDAGILTDITSLSAAYAPDATEVDVVLTTLYAAMVSEERKEHTRLGKRIKRLGVHQVLIDDMSASQAASFSRGMPWRQIAAECQARGF